MFKTLKQAVVLLGLAFWAANAASAQVIYSKHSDLTKATEAMVSGELETASLYFKRATKRNLTKEQLVPALNNHCAIEYALGNFENAEDICSRAIGKKRSFWRAYVNRGNARLALGQLDEAYNDYKQAVKLRPSARIARNALAKFENLQAPQLAQNLN